MNNLPTSITPVKLFTDVFLIEVNDVVIVVDFQSKSNDCPLRIEKEVYPEKDSKIKCFVCTSKLHFNTSRSEFELDTQ